MMKTITVGELKAEMKKVWAKTSVRKAELVERLAIYKAPICLTSRFRPTSQTQHCTDET